MTVKKINDNSTVLNNVLSTAQQKCATKEDSSSNITLNVSSSPPDLVVESTAQPEITTLNIATTKTLSKTTDSSAQILLVAKPSVDNLVTKTSVSSQQPMKTLATSLLTTNKRKQSQDGKELSSNIPPVKKLKTFTVVASTSKTNPSVSSTSKLASAKSNQNQLSQTKTTEISTDNNNGWPQKPNSNVKVIAKKSYHKLCKESFQSKENHDNHMSRAHYLNLLPCLVTECNSTFPSK